MRVTVRDARGQVAAGEVLVRDPKDDCEVIAAAKKVCSAKGVSLPKPATIEVAEGRGGRWKPVRKLVA